MLDKGMAHELIRTEWDYAMFDHDTQKIAPLKT